MKENVGEVTLADSYIASSVDRLVDRKIVAVTEFNLSDFLGEYILSVVPDPDNQRQALFVNKAGYVFGMNLPVRTAKIKGPVKIVLSLAVNDEPNACPDMSSRKVLIGARTP